MKNLTIRRRIVASFAVVVAVMVAMAAVAYTRLTNIEQQAAWIANDALLGLTYTNQILVDRMSDYALTQAFVLQTDMGAKQKLRETILASRAHLDTRSSMSGSDWKIRPSAAATNGWSSTSRTTMCRRPSDGRDRVSSVGSIMLHSDARRVVRAGLCKRAQCRRYP